MIKQIIFDCDGVLVDTEIVAAEVMQGFLSDYSVSVTIEEYLEQYTGKTFSNIIESLGIQLNQTTLEVAHRLESEIYNKLRAIDGMQNVIKSLELPIALASNSKTWQVEKAIDFLGIKDNIGGNYFSSEMVRNPKPAADIYLYACKSLNKSPSECLVVEDSKSGVEAALSAGMNVIGFCGGSHIRKSHEQKLRNLGVTKIARNAIELTTTISGFLS